METCVLVPPELSVVLRIGPFESSEDISGGEHGSAGEDKPESGRRGSVGSSGRSPGIRDRPPQRRHPLACLEMTATVWSNIKLLPGTTFSPDEGSVRLEKLEIYSKLKYDDVRYQFGMFDEIHLIDDEEVRHCNWVRFLRSMDDLHKVNMIASKVAGNIVYQVVSVIPPNGELTVYFDPSAENILPPSITDTMLQKERLNSSRDSSDNITPPRSSSNKTRSSPESTRSLGVQSLMTSPSDKEDDVRSTLSDVTNISEDSHNSHSVKSNLSMNSSFSSDARTPGGVTASPSPRRPHAVNDSTNNNITPPNTRPSPSSNNTFSSPIFTSPSLTSPSLTSPSMSSPRGSVTSSPLCGKSPEDYMRLPVKRNRERTWLPCDVCGKKFDRPSLLRRHMRTHTGEKPHACDVCGKAFSTSSSLNTHRRIHSGEKPHQCPTCGKRFTASSNLYYHRMTHNKDKPHKCTLCSKSFPTPGDLKSHMYVHNGSWPYKCDVCNRGFSKHTNLKNHLLLHTGDKPHECDLCGKRFALQCNLKTHLKTHEGEPQEECYKCGKIFLVSSRQVYNGYCRPCLQTGPSPGNGGSHPGGGLPHSTPGPNPGAGGPSPAATPRHHSFSVESLATSSIQRPTPLNLTAATPGGASGALGPGGASGALSMSAGYAMFETKPEIGSLPGSNGHGNPAIFSYAAGLQWPKLVPQQY